MTVIAWDGFTLAADKQAEMQGTLNTVTKIWRHPSTRELITGCGDYALVAVLRDWYMAGADPAAFPVIHEDSSADLYVIKRVEFGRRSECQVLKFEGYPVPIIFEDKTFAAGAGRDYAIGAMAMGATAEQAVQITCNNDSSCGRGIDTLELA